MSSKDKMISASLIIFGVVLVVVGIMFSGIKMSTNNDVYSENGQSIEENVNKENNNESNNNDIQIYSEIDKDIQNPSEETNIDEENTRYIY